ncbi:unnamed protein product [Coffea canephora]|uniref:Protein kinase domain-containing protein n=1 Tax=Coffea canephora TaxID=49390 RepID=A0A068UCI9_COFCA|nr:unnamed protein product [Coffea canephora]
MMPLEFKACFLCIFAVAVIASHAQNLTDFISIDCGLREASNYSDDKTGIPYSTDANFTDSGENSNIARDYISDSLDRQLWTVRSFPRGPRNCYSLSVAQGKGKKYLIRATFLYGNYDSKNQTPTFDLYLGVEMWDTVEINSTTIAVTKEIIHVPSSNHTHVCLVNTGAGTPFISSLELRPLDPEAYPTDNTGESLASFIRLNLAPADTGKVIRYPDDIFDRRWLPYPTPSNWAELNTSLPVAVNNNYQPPAVAMQTAVTPQNASNALKFFWRPPDPTVQFYVYLHFAEVVNLQSNETRAFYVNLKDEHWYNGIVVPKYLALETIYATGGGTKASFDYSLVRTENSTLPPLINALEVYSVKHFLQSQTNEIDVWSILNIKSTYGVNNRNWQGDPCLPAAYVWQGLDCLINTNNKSDPPRIKSLNLSSSGLTGNISPFLSNLSSLENLDLSNNSLTGQVPDFLADLPSLKVLNLSRNQFSGPLPQKLLDKAKNGLELRADGYTVGTSNSCQSGRCKEKKSKKFVVPLVVSLSVSLTFLAVLIVLWRLRRGKHPGRKLGGISNRKDGFLETKNIQFTYSDLLKITNNFQRVLGKGGFGTVYHGLANGQQVAVKLLSQSSAQGYNEFQTEAELLTRVHHRNLTCLVGYCYEDTHMALVYEYMANGNLRELLSVKDDNNVLSWAERLQIALDAAQGLDYLHNGCKPPIIHRDIKSTNILLNEKFEAKLADFGLSRVFTIDDGSFVSTRVVGTPGYVDPEYYETQRLHEKSDIYSLGIVILELITGRPVIIGTEDKRHILQWANFLLATGDIGSIVDPKLKGMYEINSAWKALEVAMACASPTSYRRPNMAHVLAQLTECLAAEKARTEGLEDTGSQDLLEVNLGVLGVELGPR